MDAIRLRITSGYDRVQPSRNVQIAEIRVSEQAPPTNVALNATATASSSQPAYPAGLAVDGSTGSFWVSQTGPTAAAPQWLTVDLGREVAISHLAVTPRVNGAVDHGPRTMVWQVGDGAGGWGLTDVVSREKPFRASDTVDVDVTARHVRLLVTPVWEARNLNVQVAELQMMGRRPSSGNDPRRASGDAGTLSRPTSTCSRLVTVLRVWARGGSPDDTLRSGLSSAHAGGIDEMPSGH